MKDISLKGKWKFHSPGNTEWLEGEVPGSVYADLLKNKKMKDPFYRANEDEVKKLSNYDYVYEKEFEIEESFLDNDSLNLIFEGIDTVSEIYVNNTLLSTTNNMHRTYVIDVSEVLKKGRNTIQVNLFSPLKHIKKEQERNPIWGVEDAVEGFPHLRKGHSMFGWDWGPQLPDMGIWRDVYIKAEAMASLDDISITQNHLENEVELQIGVTTKQWRDAQINIQISVTDPNGREVAEASEGHTGDTSTFALSVQQPQKWYPSQYGEQPLYKVHVKLSSDKLVLDEHSLSIGLRTIEVVNEPDEWGKSFYFKVNGMPIFAKGANYIPEDNILARVSIEKTEELIKNCVKANFNMIRIWGGGHYPSNEFYDLCDRYGLIVWQDFMFACAVYDLNEEFEETVKEEIKDNVRRLRHHASLGIWCGNNEMEHAWVSWDFPKTEKLRKDYLTLFESVIPSVLKELDPITFYWPSSPSSGGEFEKPNDENEGDVHYWEVWHGLKPFTEYRKFHFRFVSEFGFQSFPSFKTVETFTKLEDRNIFSYVMEKHQKNGDANGKILYYLAENFKYPKDFNSLLYTSQLLQGEAIKYGVEHWRRNMGRSMGAIYWQLNDCWPVASWSSVDYYGRWKALNYFAKKFFAMVLLSAEENEKGAKLVVTNDYAYAFRGKVKWELRSRTSNIVAKGEEKIIAGPASAEIAIDLDFTDILVTYEDRRANYLSFSLEDASGLEVSKGTTLFVPAKHFTFYDPELALTVEENETAFEITVKGKNFSKFVELTHEDDVVFSDNYFDVIGKDKYVIVRSNKKELKRALTLEEFTKGISIRSLFDTFE